MVHEIRLKNNMKTIKFLIIFTISNLFINVSISKDLIYSGFSLQGNFSHNNVNYPMFSKLLNENNEINLKLYELLKNKSNLLTSKSDDNEGYVVSFGLLTENINFYKVNNLSKSEYVLYPQVFIYDNETKYIHVDGNEGYQKTKKFMKELMPKYVKYVKKYRGKIPLFHDALIEKELNNIFEPTVKLKSGGYLVINPTEALVAIDINSGQSTKQMNIEKTAVMIIMPSMTNFGDSPKGLRNTRARFTSR